MTTCDKQTKTAERLTLEAIAIGCAQFLGPFASNHMRLCIDCDAAANRFIGMLRTYMMSERIQEATEEVTFQYPASWWQHFKAECFPEWLKRLCPPRMATEQKVVRFEVREVYPQFATYRPEEARGSFQKFTLRTFGRERFDEVDEDL